MSEKDRIPAADRAYLDARFGFSKAETFMLTHARLLERRLFEVTFLGGDPASVGRTIRAYQNADGGLGHALEPDARCRESQPLFVGVGLQSLWQVGHRDPGLALGVCDFLASVADEAGLFPPILENGYRAPHAPHWTGATMPDLNPAVAICGLLHDQGIEHPWLTRATETCCERILREPPREAHTLLGATYLVDHLPDRELAARLRAQVAAALPRARFFLADPHTPGYGLTPLTFAIKPTSPWRSLFSDAQIRGHLDDLRHRQEPDGGWPITWEAPGPASTLEWRGLVTWEAVRTLAAYARETELLA